MPVIRSNRRGLAYIELLLVVAIIAMLTTIGAPRYAASLRNFRTDAAARRIVADFTLAQRTARSAGSDRTVTFDLVRHGYSIPNTEQLGGTGNTYSVELSDNPYRAQLVSADFSGAVEVTFDGYGQPDSGGSVVVQSGGVQKTVVLDAITGKASVQ